MYLVLLVAKLEIDKVFNFTMKLWRDPIGMPTMIPNTPVARMQPSIQFNSIPKFNS